MISIKCFSKFFPHDCIKMFQLSSHILVQFIKSTLSRVNFLWINFTLGKPNIRDQILQMLKISHQTLVLPLFLISFCKDFKAFLLLAKAMSTATSILLNRWENGRTRLPASRSSSIGPEGHILFFHLKEKVKETITLNQAQP